MPSPRSLRRGHRYRVARARMFEEFGRVCIHCGHGGATDADHLEPVSLNPEQGIDWTLMRPAHGVAGCAVCGRKCNQERGIGPITGPMVTSREW
jgi:hypothetical protein